MVEALSPADANRLKPAGRRERKKQSRKAELLRLARQSFCASGYDATSMESIAAAADIAVGTVYNYFPTKSDLLFNVFLEDIQPILNQQFDSAPESDSNPLLALIRGCFEWFDRYDRSLIRRFTADALLAQSEGAAGYFLFDELLANRTRTIVMSLYHTGKISSNLDPEICARLIFNVGNAEFYSYIMSSDETSDSILKKIESQLDVIWPRLKPVEV